MLHKTILLFSLTFLLFGCKTQTTDYTRWEVIYPNPADSSIVKVKGLYHKEGILLFNNEDTTNYDGTSFFPSDILLLKPTPEQIIQGERKWIEEMMKLTGKNASYVVNYYSNYYRQYTVYTCKSGNTIMFLNLVKFPIEFDRNQRYGIKLVLEEPSVKKQQTIFWYVILNKNIISDDIDFYCDEPIKFEIE